MRLQAFLGTWDIERSIEDRLAGQQGRFGGQAVFAAGEFWIDYHESGTIVLGSAPALAATRAYRWLEDGEEIEVRFGDGRPFHRFRPGDAAPEAVHQCPPDLYRVRYDFRQWPAWEAIWDVRGPRKDYCMLSRFRPAIPKGYL